MTRLEESVVHLERMMVELHEQLRLHANDYRSRETEYPADQRAKKALSTAEEWLYHA